MRILLTADPEIPVPPIGYGGIERIVDSLVRHYRGLGHCVGLLAHKNSPCAADELFGWPGRTSQGLTNTLHNALALRRAVRSFRPHVLHSFSRLAYLLPVLPSALPKVMSYQRHTGGRQIRWAARVAGPSLHFTGCSEFICRMGRPAGGRWTAIPNFVEPDKYTFTPVTAPDAPLVFLSRVESIKGPDLAIAIARASGRRLVIAGNRPKPGPEAAFWEREVAPHLGRDGVDYVGELNDVQKSALLGQAAALLVPIQWDEPFGIVFAEAFACGTPVVTCPRGAAPEIVTPERTGFLIRDVAEGVAAVSRLGQIDRRECRREAETRFSVAACAAQYWALYQFVVQGTAHARSGRRSATPA